MSVMRQLVLVFVFLCVISSIAADVTMQPKVFFTSFALCVRSASTNVSSFIGQGHVYISVQPDQSPYFLNRIRQPQYASLQNATQTCDRLRRSKVVVHGWFKCTSVTFRTWIVVENCENSQLKNLMGYAFILAL
uniref:Secreted protein n=1 Tax=Ascaris lumbricoides TaxID=6252 RepID=A0A0M3I7L3_ASCLU